MVLLYQRVIVQKKTHLIVTLFFLLQKMKMRESQDVQVSTLFNFTSKDNREIPPWKISSYSGVPLTFGNNGKYVNTPQSDCYSFYAYVAYTMKISAV